MTRLIQAHRWIGHALSGEAGSRLTKRLSLPTSPDTLLRRIREIPGRVASTPRILGVDDFAFRKGHTYGTVLEDLKRRCLIDLLPDRKAATLSKWLQAHQGIEIVSRDRGTAYAQTVRASLPQAIQVADRWHLLKNLQEALQKVFQRSSRSIQRAITTEPQPQEASMTTVEKKSIDQERLRVFQQVRTWHAHGLSLRQIMKRTGLHYVTVRRYLDAESYLDWQSCRRGQSQLDAVESWTRNELRQGNRNAASIQRKLQAVRYNSDRKASSEQGDTNAHSLAIMRAKLKHNLGEDRRVVTNSRGRFCETCAMTLSVAKFYLILLISH